MGFLVVDDEGHHQVDLVLGDLAVAHPHLLLLDPRAAHVAQRLRDDAVQADVGQVPHLLAQLYTRYAERQGWQVELISETLAIDMLASIRVWASIATVRTAGNRNSYGTAGSRSAWKLRR